MEKEKEKIVIDYIVSEDNQYIYKVQKYYEDKYVWASFPSMCEGGYFSDVDALDEWLEEYKDEIHIVKDFR